jgi:hypothetical protein
MPDPTIRTTTRWAATCTDSYVGAMPTPAAPTSLPPNAENAHASAANADTAGPPDDESYLTNPANVCHHGTNQGQPGLLMPTSTQATITVERTPPTGYDTAPQPRRPRET